MHDGTPLGTSSAEATAKLYSDSQRGLFVSGWRASRSDKRWNRAYKNGTEGSRNYSVLDPPFDKFESFTRDISKDMFQGVRRMADNTPMLANLVNFMLCQIRGS